MIGRTIQNYNILEKIGHGGMGVVYKAFDTVLQRTVALKFLPEDLGKEVDHARFLREARAASAINHPNVCTIYDLKEEGGEQFIVMEYVQGETLKQLAARQDEVSIEQAVGYGVQISSALAAAHAQGILHRDIKSENIMVTPSGQIKVMDFGLALIKGSQRLTQSSSTVGTIAYMSPEQIEGSAVDGRSDIFSFGVVFYELLTGHLPFLGETQAAMMYAILNPPPQPMESWRRVPPAIADLVYRALEKRVENRFQSFEEICTDLLRIERADAQKRKKQPGYSTSVKRSRGNEVRRFLAPLFLLLIFFSAIVFWLWKPFTSKLEKPMNILPLTSEVGVAEGASFSPDGKQIAYHWQKEVGGDYNIYIRQLGTNQVLQLTVNPANDLWPAWSPDGLWIAFCRQSRDADGGIYLISSLGGVERKVYSGYCIHPGWSPDGSQMVFFDARTSGIHLLDLRSGGDSQITSPGWRDAPVFVEQSPVFSPDGKLIAFMRLDSFGSGDIYLLTLEGGEPRRITFDNKFIFGLVWTPDGERIIFSSNRATSQKLWSVRRNGTSFKLLAASGQNSYYPALTRNGRFLAFSEYHGGHFDIGRIRIPASPQIVVPEKVIASQRDETFLDISPNGAQFTFNANISGFNEIWTSDDSGKNLLQLTTLNTHSGTPRWSPDGTKIAFDSRPHGNSDIFIVSAAGNAPFRLTASATDEVLPSWSRDGAWVYFSAAHEGRHEIWKVPAPGGDATQVTHNGGYVSAEAFDGASLYYNKRGDPYIWNCEPDGTNEKQLFRCSPDFRAWSLQKDGIYFVHYNAADQLHYMQFYDFLQTQVKTLAYLKDMPVVFGPVRSPDSQWLYVTYMEHLPQSDIVLVENFK